MFKHILVVCDGNICRSPLAAFLLSETTGRAVESAGIIGLEGHDMDEVMRDLAAESGMTFPPHVARRLNQAMCRSADLILVMEKRHQEWFLQHFPEVTGKVMLLGHWLNKEIPDPYKKSHAVYQLVIRLIREAVATWTPKL